MNSLSDRIEYQLRRYNCLQDTKNHVEVTLSSAHRQMDKILLDQNLLERTTVAIQQARPLLSISSIKQCESLANSAISSVFNLPYTVEYDVESQRFLLNMGSFKTDLVDSNGGGLATVVSFVFNVYLLVKLGNRRFLAFDEAFTAISDIYIDAFISFVKQMCRDLGVDLLLVSHDARISVDDAHRAYLVENGFTKRIK